MAVKVIEHGRTSSAYTYKFQCRCGCEFKAEEHDGYIQIKEVLYLLDTAREKWLYVECPECKNECGVRLARKWSCLWEN